MTLILEITDLPSPGLVLRKEFNGAGGSIGRAADNDWVVPDPYISGHHARIHFRDGRYLLEDVSTNGVFIDRQGTRLPKGRMHVLESGSEIFLDQLAMRVTLARPVERTQLASATQNFDEATLLIGSPTPAAAAPAEDATSAFPVDKTSVFPAQSTQNKQPAAAAESRTVALPQTPAIPAKKEEAPAKADVTVALPPDASFPASAFAAAKPTNTPVPDKTSVLPEKITKQAPAPVDATVAMAFAPNPVSAFSKPAPAEPQRESAKAVKPEVKVSDAPASSPSAPVKPRASEPQPAAAHKAKPGAASDLAALLAAAGLPSELASPELAETLGRVLRGSVEHLLQALRQRERVKESFDLQHTKIKPHSNNPLKFSANVEDALHNLFVKRNPAYLDPAAAFAQAQQEIREHHAALQAALRASIGSAFAYFDPASLQSRFENETQAKRSLFGKSDHWQLFQAHYRELNNSAGNAYRERVNEEMTRAYEEELQASRLRGPETT